MNYPRDTSLRYRDARFFIGRFRKESPDVGRSQRLQKITGKQTLTVSVVASGYAPNALVRSDCQQFKNLLFGARFKNDRYR
jgi:hypothetical protein